MSKKFGRLRADQDYLDRSIQKVERETGKSRREHVGDVHLAGEGLLGMLFDAIGFNDGIDGYED